MNASITRHIKQKDTYRLSMCGIICFAIFPSSVVVSFEVEDASDSTALRGVGSVVASVAVGAGSDSSMVEGFGSVVVSLAAEACAGSSSSTAGGFDCISLSCTTVEVSEDLSASL